MGIGGYLASKAELDHYRFQVRTTRDRVARSCVGEMEREVREILEPYGVDPKLAEQVAAQLRQVENENASAGALPAPATSSKKPAEVEVDDERGLTPFLVRLGEGLEPVAPSRMYISALTIGLSYFLGGAIPLAPYVFVDNVRTALFVSVAVTGIVLLIFGSVKAFYTGAQVGLNGYFYGSFSTLGVGGLAAGAAWAIVRALESAE